MTDTTKKPPVSNIILLILAGEAVFILPFVLARIFRPTFLDVFGISNTELGFCFSIYGLVALGSYLWGGPLADKFKPSTLMAGGLVLTAAGGFFMATFPAYETLKILFGYWGFTTILLFWSAMIKATRIWGDTNRQGLAFGFLDGGRGLVAAGVGSIGVLIFAFFIAGDVSLASIAERRTAFRYTILFSSTFVVFVGILVYFFLQPSTESDRKTTVNADILSNFKTLIKIPSVWLLMIIILCAYVGYKTTDVFSLYANQILDYDQVESAQVGTFLLYMRPIIGVTIGLLADRFKASILLVLGFGLMFLGGLIFFAVLIDAQTQILFYLTVIPTAIGIYALRTLYFAALQEGLIPLALTGSAVGLMSFIGYTPDIFMGPLLGYFLDGFPGAAGHQYVFMMLSGFSLVGLLASIMFYQTTKTSAKKSVF